MQHPGQTKCEKTALNSVISGTNMTVQCKRIYVSILRRELREVLLNRWASPRITRTITSRMCRECTIKSASFSLSTTTLRRCWSFLKSSTWYIHLKINTRKSRIWWAEFKINESRKISFQVTKLTWNGGA